MLELGPVKGKIVSHRTQENNDKVIVIVSCATASGESADARIYITEKSYGMARRALKMCGFDIETQSLAELDTRPNLLAGNYVPLIVEEYNGKTQVKIDLDARASAAKLDDLTKRLRAAKKAGADASPDDHGDIPF